MIKITMSMPVEAAKKIQDAWDRQDPELLAILKEFDVVSIQPPKESEDTPENKS